MQLAWLPTLLVLREHFISIINALHNLMKIFSGKPIMNLSLTNASKCSPHVQHKANFFTLAIYLATVSSSPFVAI